MSDRTGQRDKRRGAGRTDTWIYVCRSKGHCSESMECTGFHHISADDKFLSRDAQKRQETGRSTEAGTDRDVQEGNEEQSILLGRLHLSRRLALRKTTKTQRAQRF